VSDHDDDSRIINPAVIDIWITIFALACSVCAFLSFSFVWKYSHPFFGIPLPFFSARKQVLFMLPGIWASVAAVVVSFILWMKMNNRFRRLLLSLAVYFAAAPLFEHAITALEKFALSPLGIIIMGCVMALCFFQRTFGLGLLSALFVAIIFWTQPPELVVPPMAGACFLLVSLSLLFVSDSREPSTVDDDES